MLIDTNNFSVACCRNDDTNILSVGHLVPSDEIIKISKIYIKTLDKYFCIENEYFKN